MHAEHQVGLAAVSEPWSLSWAIISTNATSAMWRWWPTSDVTKQHTVQFIVDEARTAVHRSCELPLVAATPHHGDVVRVRYSLDTARAYDWMRVGAARVLELNWLIERVQLRSLESDDQPRLLDATCGGGHVSLSLKAAFPQLDVICIDLAADAQRTARANFEANGLDATFRQGDLFAPFGLMLRTKARFKPVNRQRASFAYVHPPQVGKFGDGGEGDGEALFRAGTLAKQAAHPSGHGNRNDPSIYSSKPLRFFERTAAELPPLLAPEAVLWLAVVWSNVDGVKKIFAAGGWQLVRTYPESGEDVAALVSTPSLLMEYLPPRHVRDSAGVSDRRRRRSAALRRVGGKAKGKSKGKSRKTTAAQRKKKESSQRARKRRQAMDVLRTEPGRPTRRPAWLERDLEGAEAVAAEAEAEVEGGEEGEEDEREEEDDEEEGTEDALRDEL